MNDVPDLRDSRGRGPSVVVDLDPKTAIELNKICPRGTKVSILRKLIQGLVSHADSLPKGWVIGVLDGTEKFVINIKEKKHD